MPNNASQKNFHILTSQWQSGIFTLQPVKLDSRRQSDASASYNTVVYRPSAESQLQCVRPDRSGARDVTFTIARNVQIYRRPGRLNPASASATFFSPSYAQYSTRPRVNAQVRQINIGDFPREPEVTTLTPALDVSVRNRPVTSTAADKRDSTETRRR